MNTAINRFSPKPETRLCKERRFGWPAKHLDIMGATRANREGNPYTNVKVIDVKYGPYAIGNILLTAWVGHRGDDVVRENKILA